MLRLLLLRRAQHVGRRRLDPLVHEGDGALGHAEPRAEDELLAHAPHDPRALGHAAQCRGAFGFGRGLGAGFGLGLGLGLGLGFGFAASW